MTDYTSLSDQIHEAAMILIAHDAIGKPDRAFWALRNSGFTTNFLGIFMEEIEKRAREIADHYQIPSRVFLNKGGADAASLH